MVLGDFGYLIQQIVKDDEYKPRIMNGKSCIKYTVKTIP